MNKKEKEIIYYNDELNDDFCGVSAKPIKIDSKFKYINKNIFYRLAKFFVYRIVMTPVAFFHTKLKFHTKYVGKEKLKPYKKTGYFLYGNHTQIPADAYFPNMITFPKTAFVVVASENVAMKGTKTFMMMSGALPIPSDFGAMRHFYEAIEERLKQKCAIVIYPEAHIWPYFTGIRNYTPVSFSYPIKFNKPSFSFTVTYRKRKGRRKTNVITYIDGPFFPKKGLGIAETKQDLRDQVYNAMLKRSQNKDNFTFIEYRKRGEKND